MLDIRLSTNNNTADLTGTWSSREGLLIGWKYRQFAHSVKSTVCSEYNLQWSVREGCKKYH